jgi:integrase
MTKDMMLKEFKKKLDSDVRRNIKSRRTANTYMNVAHNLVDGKYTDENIPSESRWLQISAVISYLADHDLLEKAGISEKEPFGLPLRAMKKKFRGGKTQNEKVRDIEEKIVTEAQYQDILAALPDTPAGDELRLACAISRESGMRESEILHLNESQIDYREDAIYIHIVGKRRKPRTVYLPLSFADRLKTFFETHPDGFTITQNYLVCTYRRIVRKLGIATTFHGLRHTFATEQSEAGIDPFVLAAILGHEDIKTTMTYRHVKQICPQQLLDLWEKSGK